MLFALAAVPAHAENYCKPFDQAKCPTVAGCVWKDGETWTRTDGKVRNVNASCKFNAKSAREALAKQVK